MESIYSKDKVSFDKLKETCRNKGITMSDISRAMGKCDCYVANVCNGKSGASTGVVAMICAILKCSVRDVITFNGIAVKPMFEGYCDSYNPPDKPLYEVTYGPLRNLIARYYMWNDEKKSIQEFFDKLPRNHHKDNESKARRISAAKKAMEAKGINPDVIGNTDDTQRYSKGLAYPVRNKLLHDKSVNMQTVYDICYVLGCTPDWVFSYK